MSISLLFHLKLLCQHVYRGLGSNHEGSTITVTHFLIRILENASRQATMKGLVIDDMSVKVNPIKRDLFGTIT